MRCLGQILCRGPDSKGDLSARTCCKYVISAGQLSSNQCKQITRFLERILPNGIVFSPLHISLLNEVSIGQQHRVQGFVSFNATSVLRHNIRTILKMQIKTETFSFTLCTEVTR
nr:Uncharacterised protein [Ipomoea batatas]